MLERLDRIAHAAAERIAALGVLGILGIGLVTVADALLRTFFASPITGLNEITAPLLALGVAACLPAGISGRVNITIDLAEKVFGPLTIAWLRIFAAAMLLLFLGIVVWQLGAIARRYIDLGQTSTMLELPVGYFLLVVAAVAALAIPLQLLQIAEAVVAASKINGRASAIIGIIAMAVVLAASLVPALRAGLGGLFALQPVYVALLCFALMWVAVFLMVPLGAATGLTGLLGASAILGTAPATSMFGTQVQEMIFNDSLAVLPLFLLMGSFATVAGLSSEIYRLGQAALGHLRGGLAHATIVGSAGFGALTGSSLATSATIGKVALPEMAERNYDRAFAAGTVAAGGTLGQLVPPSTVIVVYALLTEESIGTLFIATIMPALLAVVLYMIAVSITVRVVDVGAEPQPRRPLGEIASHMLRAWQVVLLVGLVIGGLYSGVFTETEAASVGAVGAFLIALLRGKIRRDTVWAVMRETTATVALMYVLIFGAINFSFLIGISGVTGLFVSGMLAITSEPLIVILIIVAMYLILGTVMDSFAIMIITVPVFLPLILELGYDPIWWGILTICLVETGMITPPFGLNLFILKSLDRSLKLTDVYRGVTPFVIADVVKIALLIAFPAIVLWLPSTR